MLILLIVIVSDFCYLYWVSFAPVGTFCNKYLVFQNKINLIDFKHK
uniref:Uncharacterized protein n=1 Tax=Rhizophora mucronata TaxID=61149 RepID=A0A2P2N2G8_RHIMU